jgi:hypothetical protein
VARGPAAPGDGGTLATAATAHATAVTRAAEPDGTELASAPAHGGPAEPATTALGPPAAAEPETEPPRVYRPLRVMRSAGVALGLLAILTGVGLALGALLGPGDAQPRTGPLSAGEVRGAARAFADAYGREDAAAIRRTLARDVVRVLPSGVARGREAVVAQYARQFDGKVRAYVLSDLRARGGTPGRASGTYRVERARGHPIRGRIVLEVVRERGRPRVRLIAATPSR